MLVGGVTGTIRAMFSDNGKKLRFAEPAMPVVLLGLNEVPQAGDILQVMSDLTIAREVATQRQRQQRLEAMATTRGVSLDDLFSNIQQGKIKELNIILKADVSGSIGAMPARANSEAWRARSVRTISAPYWAANARTAGKARSARPERGLTMKRVFTRELDAMKDGTSGVNRALRAAVSGRRPAASVRARRAA